MNLLGQNYSKKQIAAYMLLPQVMPRINAFYREGFSNLVMMIAMIYRSVNLLPRDHMIFKPENRHELGLRGIMSAAAAELTFDRKHIDQVIIYFSILTGLVLLVCQFAITLGYLFLNPALAAQADSMPQNYGEFFSTPNYDHDIAYKMLFSVFGVPELFKGESAASQAPFHAALHGMFQLYSIGLLVVAVITVCYFIFAILVETAQTGVPFGQRYNHVWAPIRLVFALGLLVPIGYGLNAGQWIVLYSAKFGSDFATKGWSLFNDKLQNNYLSDSEKAVGRPQAPELTNLAAHMMLVNACVYAYERIYVKPNQKQINAYLVKPGPEGAAPVKFLEKSFADAKKYFNDGDILIRFGEHSTTLHTQQLGNVAPYCGDLMIPAADSREEGALQIQEYYFGRVKQMYRGGYRLKEYAQNFVTKYAADQTLREARGELPEPTFKAETTKKLTDDVEKQIAAAVIKQNKSQTFKAELQTLKDYGWGGAGIWYNRLAQVNGSFVTAVGNVPEVRSMPFVLEYIKSEQMQQNYSLPEGVTSTILQDGRELKFNTTYDKTIGEILTAVQDYWYQENLDQTARGNQANPSGNFFIDAVNLVFGTKGLFNMCANADVHPLAQLSTLGKGLMEASIRNLTLGYVFKFGKMMDNAAGKAAGAVSSILLSVATITITMGFILFYVLPFMPFLYFFFAVTGWIKGIFEAMVGVPLWALAHLRIDGEGLQGDAATNGLYLIFEIFLRPILIVFGLLASVIIFAAMVKVLNEIFFLVVANLSGHDGTFKQVCGQSLQGKNSTPGTSSIEYFRGPIDELFFTVIYAIIVYMIGLSCFKLVDLVPNNILRYMGASVQTFNDAQEDITQGMLGKMAFATKVASEEVFGEKGVASQGVDAVANGFKGIASGKK